MNRGVLIVICFGILLIVSGPLLAFDSSTEKVYSHEEARFLMGTLARIKVSAPSKAKAVECVDAGFQSLEHADSVFSTWRIDSEISYINSQAGHGPVPISDEMAEVLTVALETSRKTGGAFDPTVLPLVELWGFRNPQPCPPPSVQAIEDLLKGVGFHLVQLKNNPPTVKFLHADTKLDFGALAKGAALDNSAAVMMQRGALGGMLDLGGGLLVFGETETQLVGVVNPLDEEHPLAVIPLSKGSVATSGQYERFRESEGQTWGHILDPRTGWPCNRTLSVTVVTESALLADALATACFVLGPTEGLHLLEDIPGCEGLVMFESSSGEPVLLRTTSWPE
jgi:FAD:protein FMN transferase